MSDPLGERPAFSFACDFAFFAGDFYEARVCVCVRVFLFVILNLVFCLLF
jgi:hypothetical protein